MVAGRARQRIGVAPASAQHAVDGVQRQPRRLAGDLEAARADGTWSSYDAIEELTVPDDLAAALLENPTAKDYFDAFPPSSKKNILWWIESAKKPETRAKRVEETVRLAAENIRANHFRQTKG